MKTNIKRRGEKGRWGEGEKRREDPALEAVADPSRGL